MSLLEGTRSYSIITLLGFGPCPVMGDDEFSSSGACSTSSRSTKHETSQKSFLYALDGEILFSLKQARSMGWKWRTGHAGWLSVVLLVDDNLQFYNYCASSVTELPVDIFRNWVPGCRKSSHCENTFTQTEIQPVVPKRTCTQYYGLDNVNYWVWTKMSLQIAWDPPPPVHLQLSHPTLL